MILSLPSKINTSNLSQKLLSLSVLFSFYIMWQYQNIIILWQWMFKNTLIVFKYFFFLFLLIYCTFQKHPGAKHLFWFGKGKVKNIFAIFISVKPKFELSLPKYKKLPGNETKTYIPLTSVLLLHSLYWYRTCVSRGITLYSLS